MIEETQKIDLQLVGEIITKAKEVARSYYMLTGRPLGITGEIAEYEAARLLELDLSEVRNSCYDATKLHDGKLIHYQIKGRCVTENANPGQRIGRIKLNCEWDAILLVLLNEFFEPFEIHEASRMIVEETLKVPGSKARNERGALGVRKFKSIAKVVWSKNHKQ